MALNNSRGCKKEETTSSSRSMLEEQNPLLRGKSLQNLLAEIQASTAHILQQKENADMEALNSRLATAEAENAELLELISRQQDSINALEEERAALESRLAEQPVDCGIETQPLKRPPSLKSLRSELQTGLDSNTNDQQASTTVFDNTVTRKHSKNALERHVEELGAQISKQASELGEIQWKIREKDGELVKAKETIAALEAERDELVSKIKNHVCELTQNAKATAAFEESQNEVIELKGQLQSKKKEVEAARAEANVLKTKCMELESNVREEMYKAQEAVRSLEEQMSAVQRLETKKQEFSANVENVVQSLLDAHDPEDIKTDSLEVFKTALLKQHQKMNGLEIKLEVVTKEKEGLQQNSVYLGAQLSRASMHLGCLEWRLKEFEKQHEGYLTEVSQLKEKLNTTHTVSALVSAEKVTLENTVKLLSTQVTELKRSTSAIALSKSTDLNGASDMATKDEVIFIVCIFL
jgi:chromosome segregation ATPase